PPCDAGRSARCVRPGKLPRQPAMPAGNASDPPADGNGSASAADKLHRPGNVADGQTYFAAATKPAAARLCQTACSARPVPTVSDAPADNPMGLTAARGTSHAARSSGSSPAGWL